MSDNKTNQNPEAQVQPEVQPEVQTQPEKKKEPTEKPTEKMVKIRLPRERDDKSPVTVWVNERSWVIQRGEEVKVPECVAEVLRNKELMLEYGIDYDEEHKAKA